MNGSSLQSSHSNANMTMSVRSRSEVFIMPTAFRVRPDVSRGAACRGLPSEQFADVGQGAAHGFGARGAGFVHAREIVPIDVVNFRLEQDIRLPGPGRLDKFPRKSSIARSKTWTTSLVDDALLLV